MISHVKFTGEFRILKPMGFEMHKYWANNHKGYSKQHSEWTTDMMIWVKGRDVQIGRCGTLQSYYVAKYIKDNKYPVYKKDKVWEAGILRIEHKAGDPKGCKINEYTGEIIAYIDFLKYYNFKHLEEGMYEKQLNDGWRDLNISRSQIDLVKEFFDKGLFELVEEEDNDRQWIQTEIDRRIRRKFKNERK